MFAEADLGLPHLGCCYSIHSSIHFTIEFSENCLPFLDILINKEDKKWMNIISIPSDSKRYVPCDSDHPKPCIRKMLFCLARRICTILVIKSTKINY